MKVGTQVSGYGTEPSNICKLGKLIFIGDFSLSGWLYTAIAFKACFTSIRLERKG